MRYLVFLLPFLFISCASTQQHSQISAPSLGGVVTSVDKAKLAIAEKRYDDARKELDNTSKELLTAQNSLSKLQEEMRTRVDRLNYLEAKYGESVGILWKWRLMFFGACMVSTGLVAIIVKPWRWL